MKSKNLAFILYVVGIMVAICGAAKLPAAGEKWPDSMIIFFIGTIATMVGLVWWRKCVKSGTGESQSAGIDGSQSVTEVFQYLKDCYGQAKTVGQKFKEMDTDSIKEEIDKLLVNYLMPFSDNRMVLIDRYGMKEGSEIILKAAFVERTFNRVWSAAADSCLPEASNSFDQAFGALEELVTQVEKK